MYIKKLDNGLLVRIEDHSRKVAGDRWYIKLVCTASMDVDREKLKACGNGDPELLSRISEHIGQEISKDFLLERNFVDDRDKDGVVEELLSRIKENINIYLAAERFPEFMLTDRYQEASKICRTLVGRMEPEDPVDEEGPADFSACFND